MRACKQCGLSIGDTATFCPVCGASADPADAVPVAATEPNSPEPAAAAEPSSPASAAAPASPPGAGSTPSPPTPLDLEGEARRCEKPDPARAAALYRQAIVGRLEDDDALESKAGRRDVQRLFDRLTMVLKRDGRPAEALEEIDAAAYLGLVDDGAAGTKAQRDALAKRRDALRRSLDAS